VLAVAKDEAIALVDAGRRAEAGKLMQARSAELKAMAETYKNASLAQVAAPAAAEAERVGRDGLDNAQRKLYRTESSQVRSQQSSGGADRR
jgi:Ca-activated chloride channel family protein